MQISAAGLAVLVPAIIFLIGSVTVYITGAGFGIAGLLLTVMALVWLIGGGVYLFLSLRRLEKAAVLMADEEAFGRFAGQGKHYASFGVLQEISRHVRDMTQRYSGDVADVNARMNSLQSQINPHFLYNTLECIRSEAILENCRSIADMSEALGRFFRYSISQRENMVSVQSELENIRSYGIIQNYRFENKFSLEISFEDEEDELLDCLIPKMTLQPLVENCIFHGLEPKPGKGRVQIRLRCTQQELIIIVTDNGVGMDEETLEKLRRSLEEPVSRPVSRGRSGRENGIALYNVNQRIRLAFGAKYGLQIYSTPGTGTDIEIIIPIRRLETPPV